MPNNSTNRRIRILAEVADTSFESIRLQGRNWIQTGQVLRAMEILENEILKEIADSKDTTEPEIK